MNANSIRFYTTVETNQNETIVKSPDGKFEVRIEGISSGFFAVAGMNRPNGFDGSNEFVVARAFAARPFKTLKGAVRAAETWIACRLA